MKAEVVVPPIQESEVFELGLVPIFKIGEPFAKRYLSMQSWSLEMP